ncbi:MAG: Ldh family oxidoreductase, partial [Spirochaetales bacterium]|nr:Ldh family oxidoreductase [Spirochaetales bacterium]
NMCAWGTRSEVLGNNPIVFAAPGEKNPVVLDMALSQYAYGKLTAMSLEGRTLPVMGGYDKDGNLTDDPNKILEARGALPIGYWKGSGFAFILDILAACLSCGTSLLFMPDEGPKVSQIYIAVKPPAFNEGYVDRMVQTLKEECMKNGDTVSYPGEGTAQRREENLKDGIRVDSGIWKSIMERYERSLTKAEL